MTQCVVTVFGGSGFLGRHLVKRLAAAGAMVRVAVRNPEDAHYLKTMGEAGQIVPVATNICDKASTAAAAERADWVINLVGILSEWGKRTFRRIHVEGAANIAEAASMAGAQRLVHVSAIGADPQSPSAYGRTKAQGEEAVKAAFTAATIVRPSIVFGPEDNFFNFFAGLASFSYLLPVVGCPFPPRFTLFSGGSLVDIDLYGGGGTKFQPVYAGDVAEAVMAILADPKTRGETFELGGPRVYSFKEIMELMLAETGRQRLLLPVPFRLLRLQAWFLEKWPKPLLTRDEVKLLEKDNVVGEKVLTFSDLGIEPTTAEAIVPTYLGRFRPPGKQHLGKV